jgi:hypothetical protein
MAKVILRMKAIMYTFTCENEQRSKMKKKIEWNFIKSKAWEGEQTSEWVNKENGLLCIHDTEMKS